MDIELTYEKWGSRLCAIGDARITYRRWTGLPQTLGAWSLDYDSLGGARLCAVGGAPITYRRWSATPVAVGAWTCEHSRLGARMLRIGPYELTYDRYGSRVRGVGPLEILYDRHGSRPVRARLHGEDDTLNDGLLLALFLVLFWQKQSRDAAAASRR